METIIHIVIGYILGLWRGYICRQIVSRQTCSASEVREGFDVQGRSSFTCLCSFGMLRKGLSAALRAFLRGPQGDKGPLKVM